MNIIKTKNRLLKCQLIFFLFLFSITNLKSQNYLPIDTVYSFKPGEGQNIGQDSLYFPDNIFGLPSDSANKDKQEVRPEEILSLGLGGEIIIGIKNRWIYNNPGPDFFIYENVFQNPFKDIYFAEPAVVSVSLDGNTYTEFPFDSLTLVGCAGTKPTLTDDKEYDPYLCGGNAFDLENIGINRTKYIRIHDITEMILNNSDHEYYDPTLTGFDLDAIIITGIEEVTSISDKSKGIMINNIDIFYLEYSTNVDFYVYDLSGKLVYSKENSESFNLMKNRLPMGCYFINAILNNTIERFKFVN